MPYKCCVYGCTTNYLTDQSTEKCIMHSFPKDELKRNSWIQALPNKDFVYTESKRICSLHWTSDCEKEIPYRSNKQVSFIKTLWF